MKKIFTLFLIVAFFQLVLEAQPVSQTYTFAGTFNYTVPAGFTANITFQAWGGGGGVNGGTQERGGGGGGGYSTNTYDVGPGSYPIVIGAGGGIGEAGGESSYNIAGLVTAGGGAPGLGSGGGAGGVGNSSNGGAGGNDDGANVGGGGGAAGCVDGSNGADGGNGTSGGAGGVGGVACAPGGAGGDGGAIGVSGQNGAIPGGGGGGKGEGGASNGAGAVGRVIVTVNAILPIELVAFDAKVIKESVLLNWQTASENNSDFIEVQRSTDGRTFSSIGQVSAAGFSNVLQAYKLEDRTPVKGDNYYRLRQVDFDGTAYFSQIRQVTFASDYKKESLRIYPTIVKNGDALNVDLTTLKAENLQLLVFDMSGQLVHQSQTYGAEEFTLFTNELAEGMYLIKAQNASTLLLGRFIKTK